MSAHSAAVWLTVFAMKIDEGLPPPNNISAIMSRLSLTPEMPEQKMLNVFF